MKNKKLIEKNSKENASRTPRGEVGIDSMMTGNDNENEVLNSQNNSARIAEVEAPSGRQVDTMEARIEQCDDGVQEEISTGNPFADSLDRADDLVFEEGQDDEPVLQFYSGYGSRGRFSTARRYWENSFNWLKSIFGRDDRAHDDEEDLSTSLLAQNQFEPLEDFDLMPLSVDDDHEFSLYRGSREPLRSLSLRDNFCCGRCPSGRTRKIACALVCFFIVFLVVYIIILSANVWILSRECTGQHSCYKLNKLHSQDLCGSMVLGENKFDLDFDLELIFDTSVSGSVLSAYSDDVRFSIHDTTIVKDLSEAPTVVESYSMTPVFNGIERKVKLGQSHMSLKNSRLSFPERAASEIIPNTAWKIANRIGESELTMRVQAKVWTTALVFPISKNIDLQFAYSCNPVFGASNSSASICRVRELGNTSGNSLRLDSSHVDFALKSLFLPNTDEAAALNVDGVVQVSVGSDFPTIDLRLPSRCYASIYASSTSVYPTLESMESQAAKIASLGIEEFKFSDAFNVSFFLSMENEIVSVDTLQMMVQRYFSNSGPDSFFVYGDISMEKNTSCFLGCILNNLKPLRAHVHSFVPRSLSFPQVLKFTEGDNSGFFNKFNAEFKRLKLLSVRTESIDQNDEPQVAILSTSILGRLPFKVKGHIPSVELILSIQNEDLVALNMGSKNVDDLEELEVLFNITFVQPRRLFEVFVNAKALDAIDIKIVGSSGTHLSFLSSLMKFLSFDLHIANENNSDKSPLSLKWLHGDVKINSLSDSLGLTFDALVNKSIPAKVVLDDCFLNGGQIEFFSPQYHEQLRIQMKIDEFSFGSGEVSRVSGQFSWSAFDEASALYSFLDDYRLGNPTPLRVMKAYCVDVSISSLPHGSLHDGRTKEFLTPAVASLTSLFTPQNGKPFNLVCAIAGYGCPADSGSGFGGGISAGLKLYTRPSGSFAPPALRIIEFPDLNFSLNADEESIVIRIFAPENFYIDEKTRLAFDSNAELEALSGLAIHQILESEDLNMVAHASLLGSAISQIFNFVYRSHAGLTESLLSIKEHLAEVTVVSTLDIASLNLSVSHTLTGFNPSLIFEVPIVLADVISGNSVIGQIESSLARLSFSRRDVSTVIDGRGILQVSEDKHVRFAQEFVAAASRDIAVFSNMTFTSSVQSNVSIGLNLDFVGDYSHNSSSSENMFSYSFGTLHIVGGRDQEGKQVSSINIPCIIPELCSRTVEYFDKFPYTSVVDADLHVPLNALKKYFCGSLRFVFPRMNILLQSHLGNQFIDVFLRDDIDTRLDLQSEDILMLPISANMTDIQLISDVTFDILESVQLVEFRYSIDDSDHSVIPQVAERALIRTYVQPKSPDGLPVPIPKELQWWFPLASVGSWSLLDSSPNTMDFSVKANIRNRLPIDILVQRVQGSAWFLTDSDHLFHIGEFGALGPLLVRGNNATSKFDALLNVVGNVSGEETAYCSPYSVADPEISMNCAVSTLGEKMVAMTETKIFFTGTVWNSYGHALKFTFYAVMNKGRNSNRYQPYVPAPRYELDLPYATRDSPLGEFKSLFHTISVDGWSSVWETMVSNGATLAIGIGVKNPFIFPIEIDGYSVTLNYDDPTGEYVSYLPETFPPTLEVSVVSNLQSDEFKLRLDPGKVGSMPKKYVALLNRKVEHACRLYNAAEKVLNLCGNFPSGSAKLGIGKFRWNQHFRLYNVTLVGSNACLFRPGCVPHFEQLGRAGIQFSVVGSARQSTEDAIVLTTGESFGEVGAAWSSTRQPVGEGFEAVFNFVLKDTALAGGGDGFAFVIQRDAGPDAVGVRCEVTPCNGYEGLHGTSFAIILYRSSRGYIELHGIINGDSSKRIGFGASPSIQMLNDGRPHQMRVFYSRNDRKVFAYIDDLLMITLNVWEEAYTDTGQCSAGSDRSNKDVCADIDTIADEDGKAWVGFTASTGYAMTSTQIISDFRFKHIEMDTSASFLIEEGRIIGICGEPTRFSIDIRDSCGGPLRSLARPLLLVTVTPEGKLPTAVDFESELTAGIIKCVFTPTFPGEYVVRLVGSVGASPAKVGTFYVNDR